MLLKNRKKKIIFLVSTGGFFGAENVNIKIINSLKGKYSFYYASSKGMIDNILKKNAIEHIEIKRITIKSIRQIELDYQPDLFHVTDYKASVFCALAGIKTPFISHLHSDVLWLHKIHPFTFAYFFAALKASRILTVSKTIQKDYIFSKFIKNRIQCISNPICCEDVLRNVDSTQEKIYDICFTGRLSEEKNPLFFLDIIKELRSKNPKIKAVMIGDGVLRDAVENKIQKEKMSDYVSLAGFQTNPYKIMNQSKILLLPSKYEGYPMVILEALILGMPCVVADVGGNSEIITEKCGFLCSTKYDYIKYIERLLNNTDEYHKFSREAKTRAKTLENQVKYMKTIDSCYQEILEKHYN